MAEEKQPMQGYGYTTDESSFLGGKFGLNEKAKIVGFAYNPNAGKDGAAAEAMDLLIQLVDEEEPRRMRVFPAANVKFKDKTTGDEKLLVTVADCHTNEERTKFQQAINRVNGVITHIMKCFVEEEKYKQTIQQRPIHSFKELVMACGSMLPKNFKEIEIDVFLEYQWNTGKNQEGNEIVYLQFPFNTINGSFLCKHVEHANIWEMHKNPLAEDLETALYYVSTDAQGNEISHPFKRKGAFLKSNSGKSLKERNGEFDNGQAVENAQQDANPTGEQQSQW